MSGVFRYVLQSEKKIKNYVFNLAKDIVMLTGRNVFLCNKSAERKLSWKRISGEILELVVSLIHTYDLRVKEDSGNSTGKHIFD